MTTVLQPDEAGIESRTKRGQNKRAQNRAACFLHLRDLVYLHPKAASADAIAFVQSLEAAVIAEKAAREKRLVRLCGASWVSRRSRRPRRLEIMAFAFLRPKDGR